MRSCRSFVGVTVVAVAVANGATKESRAAQWPPQERTVETVRTVETSDVQVLTRGPVHEAFAEIVVYDPEPDLVIPVPPPESIDEVPPDQIPEGPHMNWISGYWAWDDDRDDYLWISGVWRSAPPGRRYVPGYWTRYESGYQWTSGFWVDDDVTEIEYLPEPPESIETGPPPTAPASDLIWTPGTWIWVDGGYLWRPGSWVAAHPDWVWVPPHYVWGPRGYVFVEGYWDYTVADRGVLFAPVYVRPHVRAAPTFVYAPATVIDLDVFTDHLFVRPRYGHYYFGDYYARSYAELGIYPWFSIHTRRVGYDPIYVHRRWHHRHEPDWERRVEASFSFRREHEDARPPRTLDIQLRLAKGSDANERRLVVAKSLQQAAQGQNRGVRFRTVSTSEREAMVLHSREVKKSREERKVAESAPAASATPGSRPAPVRVRVPASPISAKKDSPSAKGPPPKKPEISAPDRTVTPKAKPKVQRVSPKPAAPKPPSETAKPAQPKPTTEKSKPAQPKEPSERQPDKGKEPTSKKKKDDD